MATRDDPDELGEASQMIFVITQCLLNVATELFTTRYRSHVTRSDKAQHIGRRAQSIIQVFLLPMVMMV